MENLNYGVIGNCRSAALVSKEGSIDWFCFPDFDSPSIFSRILDKKKGGHFSFIVSDDYTISQKSLSTHPRGDSCRFKGDSRRFAL